MDTFEVQSNATVGTDKTVVVTSLTPLVCKVAVDETTASATSINVVIKAGNKTKTFAPSTASKAPPGRASSRRPMRSSPTAFAVFDVVEPGLRLYDLDSSRSAGAADDAFKVHVGLPKAGLENLQTPQKVRIGSSSPSAPAIPLSARSSPGRRQRSAEPSPSTAAITGVPTTP